MALFVAYKLCKLKPWLSIQSGLFWVATGIHLLGWLTMRAVIVESKNSVLQQKCTNWNEDEKTWISHDFILILIDILGMDIFCPYILWLQRGNESWDSQDSTWKLWLMFFRGWSVSHMSAKDISNETYPGIFQKVVEIGCFPEKNEVKRWNGLENLLRFIYDWNKVITPCLTYVSAFMTALASVSCNC